MPSVAHPRPAVSPLVDAAVVLTARPVLHRLGLAHPTVKQVIDATAASRSRAYELKDELLALLPSLDRPVGRPPAGPAGQQDPVTETITAPVLDFVMQHPGCVHRAADRQHYSDGFRQLIVELKQQHPQVSLESFSDAAHVPLGTLKDWMRGGQIHTTTPTTSSCSAKVDPSASAKLQTIMEQWSSWHGSFTGFCSHIREHCRINYGNTAISAVLEQYGMRAPCKRRGRSPDEKALRGAFETFFPGAQWQGDGSPIRVQIAGEVHSFNLELMVDSHTDAPVGVSVRDAEDSEAVVEAFNHGVQTTGAPPLATLLDNRPSNHTDQVDEGLGDTKRMRSTKGRAQNKPHAEGAFGLFSQVVPPLVVAALSTKEAARQMLQIVAETWARTLNHRPRKDRKGRTRFDLYTQQTPTPEQVEQARDALEQRRKQQELAHKTAQARQDPFVRRILDEAFARLELLDPKGSIRAAIARYPLDAVINGIATFEAKRHARTLPEGATGRYLLGIVRNIAQQDEGLRITEALVQARLEAKDYLLAPLRTALDAILRAVAEPQVVLNSLLSRIFTADRQLDRLFWLNAVAEHICSQPQAQHAQLLRTVARRIHATFAIPYRERQQAVRFLANRVLQLE